jgi:putative transposase
MQGFKSQGSAQRFLNLHAATYNTFYAQRHLINRPALKRHRADALKNWESACAAA